AEGARADHPFNHPAEGPLRALVADQGREVGQIALQLTASRRWPLHRAVLPPVIAASVPPPRAGAARRQGGWLGPRPLGRACQLAFTVYVRISAFALDSRVTSG